MREIKFRAWDKKEKQMYSNVQESYDTISGIGCSGNMEPDDKWKSFGGVLEDENLEIMQFTGLKDKNGKEIYEGDILKVTNCGEPTALVKWDNATARFLLNFLRPGYGPTVGDFQYLLIMSGPTEVIGNVYETPELLSA